MLRRRKWSLLILVSIGLAITLALVTSWPSFYRSTATISIEEYLTAGDLQGIPVVEYAAARLRQINSLTGTKEGLANMITAAGVYSEKRGSANDNGLADFVRRRASIDLVGAKVEPVDGERAGKMNLTYTVAYRDTDPTVAKQVADSLAETHMAENRRLMASKRAERSARLTERQVQLDEKRLALGGQLEAINKRIDQSRPADAENRALQAADAKQRAAAARTNLDSTVSSIAGLEDEQGRLEHALAGHEPVIVVTREEKIAINLDARKKELTIELEAATARHGSSHAEVKKMQKSLDEINLRIRQRGAAQTKRAELSELRKVLDRMRKTKPANDPDLVMMAELEQRFMQEIATQSPELIETRVLETKRPNPEYQSLESNLRAVRERHRMAVETANALRASVGALEEESARLAAADRDQDDLVRQRQALKASYAAAVAELEKFSKASDIALEDGGGEVTLVKAAQLAAYSEKSGSYVVLIVGVVVSLALGVLYVWLRSRGDVAVRSIAMLARLTGKTRSTVVIPYIFTEAELRHVRMRSALSGVALAGGGLLLIAAVNYVRHPLSELFAQLF